MGAQLKEIQMDEGQGGWMCDLACRVTVAVKIKDETLDLKTAGRPRCETEERK